jgi:hypothetical protein
MCRFRATNWWSSPASAARAKAWPSIPSTPKDNGGLWKPFRATPGSLSAKWNAPTWTKSPASPRSFQHRTKNHRPKPALHRGHRHGSVRLSAPAVCPRRRGVLLRDREKDGEIHRRADCPAYHRAFCGTKNRLLAPVVRSRKGHYRELFEQIRKQGYTKVRVDGEILEITPGMQVDRYKIHDIEIVVDRLKVGDDRSDRSGFPKACARRRYGAGGLGDGLVQVLDLDGNDAPGTANED